MRIVQLANFYGPTSGGLRVAVDRFRAGYLERGHQCTLVVPGPPRLPGRAEAGGVLTIPSPRLPNRSGYRMIASRKAVHQALAAAAPDAIEVHDKLLCLWAWSWAAERGIPLVLFSHERLDAVAGHFLPIVPPAAISRATSEFARRLVRSSDAVVASSAFAAAEFERLSQVRRVPLGVDLARFEPRLDLPLEADGRRPVRLISVGRLSREKQPELAIATLAALVARGVSAELTLVGGGPRHGRLRTMAAGLPVRFAGYLDARQVARQLRDADVALVTGPAETFGLAALEALSCGTPIVAVCGAATAEFLPDGTDAGRVAAADPASFAAATVELLRRPPAARRLAARAIAERFSWDRSVTSMLELHRELVGSRHLPDAATTAVHR